MDAIVRFDLDVSEKRLCYDKMVGVQVLVQMISKFTRKKEIYELGIFHANQTAKCLRSQGRTKGEGWSTAN